MSWDDGKHAKVNKVQITYDDVIYSVQVTYQGTLQSQRRGSVGPKSVEFTLGSDEYITAFSAYAKTLSSQEVITGLTFTTNKKTYGPYGNKTSYQISAPAATGQQIAGFLGTSGNVLNSIDVHYAPVPTAGSGTEGNGTGGSGTGGSGTGGSGTGGIGTGGSGTGGSGTGGSGTGGSGTGESGTGGSGTGGSGTGGSGTGGSGNGSGSGAQKLEAQGGTGGTVWDDGSNHDGVTKIYVRSGGDGIQSVKFDYVKEGQPKEGALHGVQGTRGSTREVVINHPDEYLISVEGWYDSSNVIQGIQFKTNKTTSDYFGYDHNDGEGTSFTLQVQNKKIIGFHGSASNHLNSIGAYFVPLSTTTVPATKLKAEGGETGAVWDDGAHENVKKVYVGQGHDGIAAVKFEYANGSEVVFGDDHGKKTKLGYDEFEFESDEYITSVEGTYDKVFGTDSAVVTILIFKTNKNKTAGPFGLEGSSPFTLKKEGYKVVGFHGRAGETINAIGAYLAPVGTIPLIPAKPSEKLEGIGGDGGTSWDDGSFDGVRKVYVGQAHDGIGAVKFVYDKATEVVVGDEHGKKTMLGFDEFGLDYPNEYITVVEGTYDKIFGSDSKVITMLKITTNKQTSPPFGIEAGTAFSLKKEGHKIVGFHGKAGDLLHQVGVHVLPITN